MELFTVLLFCAVLILCVATGRSIVAALLLGLALFLAYGKYRRFSWRALLDMCLSGVKTVWKILLTFILIGMLTALWRASGCIPSIICYASGAIYPQIFVLLTFLLNCGVSFLTGTAFGTAGTMGVICMSMAGAMQISPLWAGGAVLSGVFFGDRCSPVSTSALLVSSLTDTDIYGNIRRMLRSALLPFLLTCGVYLAAGLLSPGVGARPEIFELFRSTFVISPVCLIPALLILLLAACRVRVQLTLAASILAAAVIAVLAQHADALSLGKMMVFGYTARDSGLSAILDGGGIVSMLRVAAIVCIASSYAGLFQGTGLLRFIQSAIDRLGERTNPFFAVLITSIPASAVACNQTLSIMLTHQLCDELAEDKESFALSLEDTAVVIAPLIPWSIAGAAPLTSAGAPLICILAACYLYLLPLCRCAGSFLRQRGHKTESAA